MEPTRRLALPRGITARQFTKLLLSLLSHTGMKWWVATVLPRSQAHQLCLLTLPGGDSFDSELKVVERAILVAGGVLYRTAHEAGFGRHSNCLGYSRRVVSKPIL